MSGRVWILCVALTGLVVLACGAGGESESPVFGDTSELSLELEISSAPEDTLPTIILGEPVTLVFRISNPTANPIRITTSGQKYEFIVEDSGVEVWRWSLGKDFTCEAVMATIEPGQTIIYEEDWDQSDNDGNPIEVGLYRLRAVYTSANLQTGIRFAVSDVVIRPADEG